MICSTRVDNRLLHGQVAYAWTKELGVNAILIANDAVAQDPVRKSMMKLAKPEGTKLVFKSVAESARLINAGATDPYRLFIIVESVTDLVRLVDACPKIDAVNLGNANPHEGTRAIDKTFYITPEEEQTLRELEAKGVRIFLQRVPDVAATEFSSAISS